MSNANNEKVFQLLDLAIGEIYRAKNCVSCIHCSEHTGECVFLENGMCGELAKPYFEWRYEKFVKTVADNLHVTDYLETDYAELSDTLPTNSINVGDALIIHNVGNCTVLAIRDDSIIVKTPNGVASIPKSSICDVLEMGE